MEQILILFGKRPRLLVIFLCFTDFLKLCAISRTNFMDWPPEGLGMTKQELEIFAETQAQTDNQFMPLLYLVRIW